VFTGLPVVLNLALFCVGAALIWWAGVRVERLTDAIASRTGIGSAFAGLVLLAAATSLPEVATTATAVLRGNVDLAVHNLLGGVAFQVVVLAIADMAGRRGPLTAFAPSFSLLMQGVGLVLMLGVAIAGLLLAGRSASTVPVGPLTLGLYPAVLLLPILYLLVGWATYRAQQAPRWRPVGAPGGDAESGPPSAGNRSVLRLTVAFSGSAAVILAGGWLSATVADVLVDQTGLPSGFVGATLLAAATSLPEVSTTVSAVRDGDAVLAVSNIFGSNAFDVSLLALVGVMAAGAFGRGPWVSPVFAAALGIVLTCVYLAGILGHTRRSVGRVGFDSAAVVVVYLAAMAALYSLA
jgi:cation:H+ antiporter